MDFKTPVAGSTPSRLNDRRAGCRAVVFTLLRRHYAETSANRFNDTVLPLSGDNCANTRLRNDPNARI